MAPAVPLGLPREIARLLVLQPLVLEPDDVAVVPGPEVVEVVGAVVVGAEVGATVLVVVDDDELLQAARRTATPDTGSDAIRVRPLLGNGETVGARRPVR